MNYYAKNLVAGIKDQDEFVAFREAIGKLKELNQQLLMKLTSGLDEKRKQHLKEIFQSQRVVVNPNEGSTLTRKMVKTVARKVANIKPPQ